MKKWLYFFLLFAFLVLASYVTYLFLYRAEFVSQGISQLFGTPVKVQNVTWNNDSIRLEKVVIYNPQDCTIQTAFSVKTIDIQMDWKERFAALFATRSAEIKKITIHSPLFGIEFYNESGSESNWKELLAHAFKTHKFHTKGRMFHAKDVVLDDVTIEFLNKAKSPTIEHPQAVDMIQTGQPSSAPAIPIERIIQAIAKISIFEIGETLNEKEFIESINEIPLIGVPEKKA